MNRIDPDFAGSGTITHCLQEAQTETAGQLAELKAREEAAQLSLKVSGFHIAVSGHFIGSGSGNFHAVGSGTRFIIGLDKTNINFYLKASFYLSPVDELVGCQCRSRKSPGFDPSIIRHSGILGAVRYRRRSSVEYPT
jgi:hypothetical protein